jgi:hypothetical protein
MSEPPPRAEPIVETLSGLGVEVDEVDTAVISGVLAVFEPAIIGLLEADLSGVVPEVDCDPSEPPK